MLEVAMNQKTLIFACSLMLSTSFALAQSTSDNGSATGSQIGQDNSNTTAPRPSDGPENDNLSDNLDSNNDGRVTVSDFGNRFGNLSEQQQGLMFSGLTTRQRRQLREECKNDATIADTDRDFCDRLERFNNQ